MKRVACLAGLVVLVTVTPNWAREQDALARLRTALGGDGALNRVQTIRARGTIANRPLKNHFDIAYAVPGRFVKVVRGFSWSDASWNTAYASTPGSWEQRLEPMLVGGDISDYERATGFDGPFVIPERIRPYLARTPEAASEAMDARHASLAEFVLPLLGATHSTYRVESTSEGGTIIFRAAGDREWRLELDAVTQLPTRMSWSYPLSGRAPASAQRTQTVTEFSDYRFVGTLRWPHRLVTSVDGKHVEDATVSRYDVNTKLPEKMFRK